MIRKSWTQLKRPVIMLLENVIIDKTNSDTESFAEPTDINAVGGGNFDE